jgi:hypothetical protein
MAEQNGGNLEPRVSALEQARRELEDAMLVHATLEKRMGEILKNHAEIIARHDVWVDESAERGKRIDERIAGLGERIDRLVSGFGEYLRREQ